MTGFYAIRVSLIEIRKNYEHTGKYRRIFMKYKLADSSAVLNWIAFVDLVRIPDFGDTSMHTCYEGM